MRRVGEVGWGWGMGDGGWGDVRRLRDWWMMWVRGNED